MITPSRPDAVRPASTVRLRGAEARRTAEAVNVLVATEVDSRSLPDGSPELVKRLYMMFWPRRDSKKSEGYGLKCDLHMPSSSLPVMVGDNAPTG